MSAQLEAKIAKLTEIIEILENSNDWYADEEARWRKEQVKANGSEMASRYDDAKGESIPIPVKRGRNLGTRYTPRASLQADHGRRARAAQIRVKELREEMNQ